VITSAFHDVAARETAARAGGRFPPNEHWTMNVERFLSA
jgi:hypothetical protein